MQHVLAHLRKRLAPGVPDPPAPLQPQRTQRGQVAQRQQPGVVEGVRVPEVQALQSGQAADGMEGDVVGPPAGRQVRQAGAAGPQERQQAAADVVAALYIHLGDLGQQLRGVLV
jgi:hypothetical protein